MRKIIVLLLLLSLVTTSAFAVSILDRALYMKVFLVCIHRYVLVHRITGKVEYIMSTDRKWVLVSPALKERYQSMYNAQTAPR